MRVVEPLFQLFSADAGFCQIHKHKVIVCITGHDLHTALLESLAECLGILHDLLLILPKLRLERFPEAHCLCRDHMHQRSALDSREYCLVEVKLLIHLVAGEDHSPARSAECLVGRCRRHMGVRDRAWMKACCNKFCNMSHVYHQVCSDFVCDLTEALEIDRARVCAGSCHD